MQFTVYMVTLALRERVPEGRVREPPRSNACAHGNALTPTLSRGARGSLV